MVLMSLEEVKNEALANIVSYRKARRDAETRRENADNNIQLAQALIDIELSCELEKRWRKVYNSI